jgi:hypothetical protein
MALPDFEIEGIYLAMQMQCSAPSVVSVSEGGKVELWLRVITIFCITLSIAFGVCCLYASTIEQHRYGLKAEFNSWPKAVRIQPRLAENGK